MKNKKMIKVVEDLPKIIPYCKCEFCQFVKKRDCPRRNEVDKFGDNIRLFATKCSYFKPYLDVSCNERLSSVFYKGIAGLGI